MRPAKGRDASFRDEAGARCGPPDARFINVVGLGFIIDGTS